MKRLFIRSPTAILIIVLLILVFIADFYTTVIFYEHFGLYANKALMPTKWYSFFTYWIVSGDITDLIYYAIMILLSSAIIEHRMPKIAFQTLILSPVLIGGGLYYILCTCKPPLIGAGFIVNALEGSLVAIWLKARSDFKMWEKIYTLVTIVSFLNSIVFNASIFDSVNYIALSIFGLAFCFIFILSKRYNINFKEGYSLDLQATQ